MPKTVTVRQSDWTKRDNMGVYEQLVKADRLCVIGDNNGLAECRGRATQVLVLAAECGFESRP